ncbi:hypothetical protein [Humibacillus xanthopallidus]|uniref:Uncharacterized protein n=1 Tax=Humibacillus xanthopallidus TaxID=412689 RepID=A0A543I0N4_9MICO|nr:hypothetical protein [Humibacillus xanthopallidus]TQM64055.1 hypothetical protein FBY41_0415 [Humibacillus xanthopallidus]
MLRAAGRGALAGLAWGLLARLFMRLIATTPEFTWGGTLAILGLSTLLGTGLGLVVGARLGGRSRWWRLAPVPGLVLFMGPGMTLVPGAALVALALAVRSRAARVLLLLAALVAVVVPAVGLDGEGGEASPTGSLGLALVIVAVGLLGVGCHEWWRRWAPPTRHTPAGARSETRV